MKKQALQARAGLSRNNKVIDLTGLFDASNATYTGKCHARTTLQIDTLFKSSQKFASPGKSILANVNSVYRPFFKGAASSTYYSDFDASQSIGIHGIDRLETMYERYRVVSVDFLAVARASFNGASLIEKDTWICMRHVTAEGLKNSQGQEKWDAVDEDDYNEAGFSNFTNFAKKKLRVPFSGSGNPKDLTCKFEGTLYPTAAIGVSEDKPNMEETIANFGASPSFQTFLQFAIVHVDGSTNHTTADQVTIDLYLYPKIELLRAKSATQVDS